MKRFITLLLATVMLLTVTLPLTSCSAAARLARMDETKRADYFYRVTDRNASYARSGSYDQTMVLDATLNGVAYKQTTVATVTFLTERDGVTYLEQAKTELDEIEFADDPLERLKGKLEKAEKLIPRFRFPSYLPLKVMENVREPSLLRRFSKKFLPKETESPSHTLIFHHILIELKFLR